MDKAIRVGMVLLAAAAVACGQLNSAAVDKSPMSRGELRLPPLTRAMERKEPPNIVLILTDDQRWDTLWAMPTVQRELVDQGVTSNAFVVNPLCCPSRASILTGQYSHTTGVYTNRNGPPLGGFAAFDDARRSPRGSTAPATGRPDRQVPQRLQGRYVPPGWDRWFATNGNGAYYDYLATTTGSCIYGSDPADYSTDVLATEPCLHLDARRQAAVPVLRPAGAPRARHAGAAAPTRVPGPPAVAAAELRRGRRLGQARVHPGPPRIDAAASARIDESAQPVRLAPRRRRAVGAIVDALRHRPAVNTLIVFASDNGLLWGEHRWAESTSRTRRASGSRWSSATTHVGPA